MGDEWVLVHELPDGTERVACRGRGFDEDRARQWARAASYLARHRRKAAALETVPPGERVYFVQHGDGGPIKIGWTADLPARLTDLQIASPVALRVLGTVAGGESVERALHGRFHHLRVRGEWFRPDPELLDFVRAQAEFPCEAFKA